MSLYRFKTFRTSYYFPSLKPELKFLYGLYTPYGSAMAKLYWKLFRSSGLVRSLTRVSNPDDEFPYSRIMSLMPNRTVVSFNMGTPGVEQKISMLGLDSNGKHFFAKYSTRERAMALSRNEIKILANLKGRGLAPELYDYQDAGDFVFFRTSCLEGKSPTSLKLNDAIIDLAIRINQTNLKEGNLIHSLSHGDFNPWNVIISTDGTHHMIDWELAGERELGYDVFSYITQVGALMIPDAPLVNLINEDQMYISKYFDAFGVTDWTPYCRAFARRHIEYDKCKGEFKHAKKFEEMLREL